MLRGQIHPCMTVISPKRSTKSCLGNLTAAAPKHQLDLETAKKSNFLKLAQNVALRALVTKILFEKSNFFYAIFSFRCSKSATIDRKYSEACKLKSKNLHYELIARRF